MHPSDPNDARQIVGAYVARLEHDLTINRYPMSRAALPYAKPIIRTALQTLTSDMVRTGMMTIELREMLETAYVSLADYVDDDLARLLREHREASDALERDAAFGREKTHTDAWATLAASSALVARVARAIADESSAPRDEFHQVSAGEGALS